MLGPLAILKFTAKALGNFLGGGIAGDLLFEVLPDVSRDVWAHWSKDRDPAAMRSELERLAQADKRELHKDVAEAVHAAIPEAPAAIQVTVTTYLNQVPAALRRSLRRPTDPDGRTVPADLVPHSAEDLLRLLPQRLPHFEVGQRPLPGVDWELVELLGVGGFGEVWKAHNPHLSSAPPVALKFCLDASAAKSLRNEAAVLDRVMRQGRHDGIVQLQHTYLSADKPCLEYEFVAGGELSGLIREWHRSRGGPSPEEAARVVLRLAEIVGFAHRLEPPIVHRDLKPANILLASGGRDGASGGRKPPENAADSGGLRPPLADWSLKVADFGIGSIAAGHVLKDTTRGFLPTTAAHGSYTPLYASPQQMRGAGADPRDDVYALGVIWYQLITGDLSTGRPGGTRWPRRLVEQGMPARLVDLLATCFEEEAGDRPDDARVLAEALTKALHGAPLVSPPVPDRTAAEWVARAEAHYREDDYDNAIAACNEALRLNPRNAQALFNRGESYRLKGSLDRCIADCTEALRLDPGCYLAWATRGAAFEQKADYHTALADLDEALRLRPDFVWVHVRRGDVLRMLGAYDRAIADATEAIRLEGTNARAYGTRGEAHRGKGVYDRAIADATEAIRLDPAYVLAYYSRAESFWMRAELDQAIADATQAIRLDPTYFLAFGIRGAAFRSKGDFAAALKDLNECLRLAPGNEWAQAQRDLVQHRQR